MYTVCGCDDASKIRNTKTGRCVLKNGNVGKTLEQ